MKSFVATILSGITIIVFTYILLEHNKGVASIAGSATTDLGNVATTFNSGPKVG